jgi:integrase
MAGPWDWEAFDRMYGQGGDGMDLERYLLGIEQEFVERERLGTAGTYRYAAGVVHRYMKGRPLLLQALTADMLYGMDKMLRANGAQDAGVSFVMRTIRAAVNRAMKAGLMPQDRYPFATSRTKGYEMKELKQRSTPRALSLEELERVKAFDLEAHPQYATSVRLFLFSYYARGMSWVDMAHLRRTDVVGGRIQYRRRKTMTKVDRVLSIPLGPQLRALLDAFGPVPGGWLLPIFGDLHRTVAQQRWRHHRQLEQANKDLKAVGVLLGIGEDLTTYVARHTYATTLKRKQVSVAKISEAMGHSSLSTTEIYLAQFGSAELDATDELL